VTHSQNLAREVSTSIGAIQRGEQPSSQWYYSVNAYSLKIMSVLLQKPGFSPRNHAYGE
jgi:hypothetical protein